MENEEFCCDEMLRFTSENELGLLYVDKFRDFGLEYRDGGTSYQCINFCPFCGVRFPTSLRDKWFDEIEAKGLNPWGDEIPEEYKSSKWWSDIALHKKTVNIINVTHRAHTKTTYSLEVANTHIFFVEKPESYLNFIIHFTQCSASDGYPL